MYFPDWFLFLLHLLTSSDLVNIPKVHTQRTVNRCQKCKKRVGLTGKVKFTYCNHMESGSSTFYLVIVIL